MPDAPAGFAFQEQIDFFRQKVNLPTATWTDIQHAEHARSFVVAGAMREQLLADFRVAVDKAISDGTTLEEFRRDFDQIVARNGWTYNGGRNWRSRVIYETNLRTSYAAGRWAQVQEGKAARPYVRYRHNDSVLHPRPLHVAWDGLVLPVDSPWIATHWPPNGWGCRCYIEALGPRDLAQLGKTKPDTPPPSDDRDVVVGTQGPNPRVFRTPAGVDPGFGYAPGASLNRPQAAIAYDEAEAQATVQWRPEVVSDWRTFNRPEHVPLDAPIARLAKAATSVADASDLLAQVIGAPSTVFDVKGLPVYVDAQVIAEHIADDLERSAYFPLLTETLADPFEVWVSQEIDDSSGTTRLRARIIKAFELDRKRGLIVVADAGRGYFQGWTVFPTSQLNYLQKQRLGVLLFGR